MCTAALFLRALSDSANGLLYLQGRCRNVGGHDALGVRFGWGWQRHSARVRIALLGDADGAELVKDGQPNWEFKPPAFFKRRVATGSSIGRAVRPLLRPHVKTPVQN